MPTMKWTELAASPGFKAAAPEEQEKARIGFFNQHVAPTAPRESLPALRQEWDARTLPKPAAPAANVANPDSNVTSPNSLARPAPAGQAIPRQSQQLTRPVTPQGGSGFIEGVKDIGRGIARGVVEDLPASGAKLVDYLDTPTYDASGKLSDNGAASVWAREKVAAAEKRGESWQQSEYGRQMQERDALSFRGGAFEGGKGLPLSFGPMLSGAAVGGAVGGLPGAAVGAVVGSISALPLFFGAQAKDTYDKVFEATRATNPDLSDEQVHDEAMKAGALTGGIEAGGELAADLVGAKLFKMLPGSIKDGLVKQATKGFQGAVPMVKGMAKLLGAEVGTELAQGAAQAEIEKAYGVGEGATWDNQKGVIVPTVIMSLIGGGAAVGLSANQRYRTAKLLQNTNLPAEQRLEAAKGVAQVVAEQDPELADMFYQSAAEQIAGGRPVIARDDRFYRDFKPLDQREIDKRMAEGDFSDPEKPFNPLDEVGKTIDPLTPDQQFTRDRQMDAEHAAAQPDFQEVDDGAAPVIVDSAGNATAPGAPPADVSAANQPVTSENTPSEAAPDAAAPTAAAAEAAGASQPQGQGMSRPMRQTYMADISAQLKVTREEYKAAKAAGDEQAMAELEQELQAIAANYKRVANGQNPEKTPRQQRQAPEPTSFGNQGAEAAAPAEPKPVLQNRNRATPASIEQMTSIAANPDYTRLGFSRDFANGAPVVEPGAEIPEQNMGRQDVATTATGRKIPVQYAVVEADQLLPSNRADGSRVPEYEQGVDGTSRAIAGNGRVAGLQRAYEQGTAAEYTDGVAADAALHGIPEEAVRAMAKPVLVRIMPQEEVTDNIGDESNTSGTADLTPAEQARNDTRRIDINAVELDANGDPSEAAVNQFIASMPTAERAGLMDGNRPNRQAYDRLGNAVFAQAYESDELLRLAAEATDPEVRNILGGLKIAAGKKSRLKGAGRYDIRGLVVEAAEAAVNAARSGQSLKQYLEQGDMGRNQAIVPILEMMAENIRSPKKIGEHLSNLADVFYNEASLPESDMFGTVEKRSPQQLLDETYGTETATAAQDRPGNQEGTGNAGRPDTATGSDDRKTVAPVEGSPAEDQAVPAEEVAPTEGYTLSQETESERVEREKLEQEKAETAKKAEQEAEAKAKKEKEQRDTKSAVDSSVHRFELGQDVDQQLSGQTNLLDVPEKPKSQQKLDDLDAQIEAAAAELAELLKPKPGTLNTGVDPQILLVGTKLGSLYIQKGLVKFAQWAQAIIAKMREMGVEADQIKPHLKEIYAATQQRATDEQFNQMDDARTVRGFDIDGLESGAQAEHPIAKLKAEREEANKRQEAAFARAGNIGAAAQDAIDKYENGDIEIEEFEALLSAAEVKSTKNKPVVKAAKPEPSAELPPILTKTKKAYLSGMALKAGLKKSSPGYQNALDRLEDQYEEERSRAEAELTFGAYNALNKDTPEPVNRQAHDALREEFGMPAAEGATVTAAIDAAAHEAATSPENDRPDPTDAQKEAGNYKMGHINVQGLDVTIENPKGSTRSGTSPDGSTWSNEMGSHYGYIKRTEGADGEHVDVYVGPNPESETVFIVDQVTPEGDFDEHKVMLGFDTQWEAEQGYLENYADGWEIGPITEMPVAAFKEWLASGSTELPATEFDDGGTIEPIWIEQSDELLSPPAAEQPARPAGYGAKNKLVTADRAQELRDKIKAKLGTLNAGIDPEMLAIGAELAVFHIEAGARKFADFAAAIASDLGVSVSQIRPYLRSWYNGARDMMEDNDVGIEGMDTPDQVSTVLKSAILDKIGSEKEAGNAERRPESKKPDSGNRPDAQQSPGKNLSDERLGGGRPGTDKAGAETGGPSGEPGESLDMFGPANAGKRSDKPLYSTKSGLEAGATRDTDDPGSRPDSTGGLFAELDTDAAANYLVEKTPAVIPAAKKTLDKHQPSNLDQIKAQMPFLTEGQAEDVVFAENRLGKPDGTGVLFTNGTGTGKTFTGLAIVKRMVNQGKGRILIAAPTQAVADAWVKTGKNFFGLDVSVLDNTRDAGKGIVVTTFANMGTNNSLIDEKWDGFVIDEAHYLSANQAGKDTNPLDMIRALGKKRDTAHFIVGARFPELSARRGELFDLIKDYSRSHDYRLRDQVPALQAEQDRLAAQYGAEVERAKAELAASKPEDKPRGIFLSATPFAYEKSVQWANEWLFDWGTDEKVPGYNSGNEYDKFMMTHFGYRMRYNKLTEPDAKVDRGLMQRTFNTWLKKEGVLSGRALDSDFDYDRLFVIADSAIGRRVDDALEWLREQSGGEKAAPGMREVHDKIVKDNFDYQSRMYFLEAIKAKEAVGHIKEHLALGRKVIVFHDYKKGGATNPFHISPNPGDEAAAYQRFVSEFSDLIRAFDVLPSPIDQLTRSFPDALVYNGSVTPKNRIKMQDQFNSDAPGSPRIMIAQSDAAREGISLHDTTSKHPRTSINLGMPAKPTATIQLEGRTYRTGQASNAMFRYFTIGTNWERYAFASKIAVRADAADNLAMGELARGLKNAFISAYEEADSYPAGFDGEGTGGKEKDKSFAGSMTPWDMAKSFYFGTKKQGSGRAARGREGVDYFATPEPVGLKMMQLADMRGGESALEPSAGHGAIARWFPENVEGRAIEFEDSLASKLALHFDGKVETGDFMQHNIVNKYDSIVMNPPFGAGGADARDHVAKAIKHLRDGGRIVALIPTGPAADKKFDELLYGDNANPNIYIAAEIKLPGVTFERAGTAQPTRILVLEKQADATLAAKIQQTSRDYSDVETVADLFDRMESMEIKPRVKPVIEEEDISPVPMKDQRPTAAPPAPGQTGGIETWEAKHSQTGADLYMAKAKAKVSRDQYQAMAAVAKQHGGYWSRFGVAGFLFKTPENRKAFVDAMSGDSDIAFRLSGTDRPGLARKDADKVVARILAGWKDGLARNDEITIVDTFDQLPEAVKQRARDQGVEDKVVAVFHNGKVHINLSKIQDERRLESAIFHETYGHYGLRKLFGKELPAKLSQLYMALGGDKGLREIAARHDKAKILDMYIRDFDKQVAGGKLSQENRDRFLVDELLAFLQQDNRPTVARLAREILGMIRQAFRRLGYFALEQLSDNEVFALLRQSRQAVQKNEDGKGDGTMFMVAYHGSPHRHNKFTAEKIGTGEGNAAFGWGLYFAQNQSVAETYRTTLSNGHARRERLLADKLGNRPAISRDEIKQITDNLWFQSLTPYQAVEDVLDGRLTSGSLSPEAFDAAVEAASEAALNADDTGQMYRVELPENDELLDWNALLIDQPPAVKEALRSVPWAQDSSVWQHYTGEQLYESEVNVRVMMDGMTRGKAQESVSKELRAAGIPGHRYLDEFSRNKSPDVPAFDSWAGYFKGADMATASDSHLRELRAEYQEFVDQEDTRTRNFVIYDDERIEITDTMFMADEEQDAEEGANTFPASSDWVMPEETKMSAFVDKWIYRGQNKQVDLKRVQKAISDAGRTITEENNAYLKEELFHGRSASRVSKFLENELDPLVADMAARKVSQEDLGKYLWARHAKEANAHIARINPEHPDGGSGMTDAEADAYMADLEPGQRVDFEALAGRIDAIVQETREGMVRDDLISEATKNTWESAYQFYVPLFRDMDGGDTDPMSHGMGTGQGYSIKGAEAKRRTGSALPVADILGNIANARDRAIVRGEKARVGRALYALALTNPNPEFWRTAAKAPLIKTHDKDGMVIEIPDPMFKQRDNVVVVKVKTEQGAIVERAVIFNERDERAMRMAHAIKNLDGQQLGELLSATASVTRYFAKINTQYNPIFGIVNLVRDTQASLVNLSSTPLAGHQLAVAKNSASIMAGALKHGGRRFSDEWQAMAEEFEQAGGKTGYRDMFSNARERTQDIERALSPDWWTKRPWGKALTANGYLKDPAVLLVDKGLKPVFDWLSDYNDTLENATRLAVYKQARDMDLSPEAAASIAKNISTNFNRKGEMALQLGSLYAFFNAAVQGTTRVLETLSGPAGRRVLAGGIMVGVVQAVMMALAGYDDDEPPQFVRERNLIFPIPGSDGKHMSLAMPLGFHVLPNIGRLMVEIMRGGNPAEKLSSMMAVMADAFNPLGGSAPLAQIAAPTIADPIISLSMNQDWTGKPIAREDFNSMNPTPGFTRSRDIASAPAKAVAKFINAVTGGSDYRKGMASPTGDQIDYLVGQLTGGIGREAIKVATTASALVGAEELPAYKIPLVGRFYGETQGQASHANRFYSNIKRLNAHKAEIEGLRADRKGNEAMEYMRDNPEARLFIRGSKSYQRVQKLRRQRREMVERGASRVRLERIDKQITQEMARLNDMMAAASG